MTNQPILDCHISFIDKQSKTMAELFKSISKKIKKQGLRVGSNFAEDMEKMEKTHPSSIGSRIGVKQVYLPSLDRALCMLVRCDQKVDFNSFDNQNLDMLYIVFSPEKKGPLYLQKMAKAARILKDDDIRLKVLGATDEDAIQSIFYNMSSEKFAA